VSRRPSLNCLPGSGADQPLVVAGDFNTPPDSPQSAVLRADLRDAWPLRAVAFLNRGRCLCHCCGSTHVGERKASARGVLDGLVSAFRSPCAGARSCPALRANAAAAVARARAPEVSKKSLLLHFMRIAADRRVRGEDDPVRFLSHSVHPLNVSCGGRKAVLLHAPLGHGWTPCHRGSRRCCARGERERLGDSAGNSTMLRNRGSGFTFGTRCSPTWRAFGYSTGFIRSDSAFIGCSRAGSRAVFITTRQRRRAGVRTINGCELGTDLHLRVLALGIGVATTKCSDHSTYVIYSTRYRSPRWLY
jgi:hypothetical protein